MYESRKGMKSSATVPIILIQVPTAILVFIGDKYLKIHFICLPLAFPKKY
jgi:hypothetical protein